MPLLGAMIGGRDAAVVRRCATAAACVMAFSAAMANAQGGGAHGTAADQSPEDLGKLVCGPRCVRFLLSYYGKGETPTLVDLIREVQWPDLRRGAALSDLAAALERQGIHTYAMEVSPRARLCWQWPVLVHLRSQTDGIGHYAVWLPDSTAAEAHVWIGLAGVMRKPTAELAEEMTGPVLLTADQAIVDAADAVAWRTDSLAWLGAKAVVLGLMVTVVVRARRRLLPWRWFARRTTDFTSLDRKES